MTAKERMVQAALDEFTENGYDGTSMHAVAKRAGVSAPLLKYHFRTKDEIAAAARELLFSRVRMPLEPDTSLISDDASWRAVMRTWLGLVVDVLTSEENGRCLTALCRDEARHPEFTLFSFHDTIMRPAYQSLVHMMELACPDGRTARMWSWTVWSMVVSLCFNSRSRIAEYVPADCRVANFAVDSVLAGIHFSRV